MCAVQSVILITLMCALQSVILITVMCALQSVILITVMCALQSVIIITVMCALQSVIIITVMCAVQSVILITVMCALQSVILVEALIHTNMTDREVVFLYNVQSHYLYYLFDVYVFADGQVEDDSSTTMSRLEKYVQPLTNILCSPLSVTSHTLCFHPLCNLPFSHLPLFHDLAPSYRGRGCKMPMRDWKWSSPMSEKNVLLSSIKICH